MGGFSVVHLPDTHYSQPPYNTTYPILFNWIVANKDRLNIQAVMHSGDLIQNGDTHGYQWDTADAAVDLLDTAGIPYLLAPGNHDYTNEVMTDRTATLWNTYFGQARYAAADWWAGGFQAEGHSENAYNILTIGGVDYLFMVLEFGPRDAILAWADGVLTAHADKLAIIATHSHTHVDGELVDATDNSNPTGYPGTVADANVGADVWTELLKLHDNVILVVSGHHYVGGSAARRQDVSDGGAKVNEIFANYQDSDDNNGDGYFRVMKFDPAARTIEVETISPVDCKQKTDAANSFTVDY